MFFVSLTEFSSNEGRISILKPLQGRNAIKGIVFLQLLTKSLEYFAALSLCMFLNHCPFIFLNCLYMTQKFISLHATEGQNSSRMVEGQKEGNAHDKPVELGQEPLQFCMVLRAEALARVKFTG